MLWRTRFFDPWAEFERLNRLASRTAKDFPAVNVWLSEESAVVSTELPGVDADAIDISVSNNVLTIRGQRHPEETNDGSRYHRKECWHGRFSRSLELPYNIQADKVEANFKNGVLTITLPRAEAEKPKKISVKYE